MNTSRIAQSSLAFMVAVSIAGPVAHAEKREQTYVKTASRTVSKSAFVLGDSPAREISSEVQLQTSTFSNPDFKVTEEWIYLHADQVDGTGGHGGYYTYVHKDGENTYGTFEGTHNTTVKDDGSWLTIWGGKYRYLGGTGKYKNIKGSGNYKGKVGSKEPYREEGREQIEY